MKNHDMSIDSGFDTGSGDTDMPPTRKLGLGDTKKVLVMVGLLVVGGGIVAYQFLGGTGPTPATAVTTPAAPGPTGSPLPAVPVGTAAPASPEDELSVAGIERLVKEFDGYVKARQVPLAQLKTSPFRTKPVRPAPHVEPTNPDSPAVAEPRPVKVAPRPTLPQLALGSIMVAGDKRWAVINNRLCSVGSIVAGCRVDVIEADHVRISRDGETADLLLKPPSVNQE
jgi:hypothetical protein